jgi:DNA-dependent metalloprotease WSS1
MKRKQKFVIDSSSFGVNRIEHNSKVPDSATALGMLQQLQREFAPLLRQRNWKVDCLVEMCCCSKGGGIKRSPNILGMCHKTSNSIGNANVIEIRLREPNHHSFKDFEYEVVGTMCHELAHIVHSAHDAKFYQLMDEIGKQFDETRSSAGVDGQGTFSGQGKKLDSTRHNPKSARDLRLTALKAAENRMRIQKIMGNGGNCLGGGRCVGGSSWRTMTPKQASAQAAIRRFQDNKWCEGTTTSDVSIPMSSSSSSPTSIPSSKNSSLPPLIEIVDDENEWTCNSCTLINPALVLCCNACAMQKS